MTTRRPDRENPPAVRLGHIPFKAERLRAVNVLVAKNRVRARFFEAPALSDRSDNASPHGS
jgi:hypothetical protein